jgi:Lrp/AsnC family leucine-responsive transcriptional regulator
MLDQIDLKILYILQNHGRSRLADIADEVELSAPAVMERVKKLEASGVIRGYQALLDAKQVGKDITAFISVSIGQQREIDKFAEQMLQYPDVLECHHVTGDESFILKVKAGNTGALEKLLAQFAPSMESPGRLPKLFCRRQRKPDSRLERRLGRELAPGKIN